MPHSFREYFIEGRLLLRNVGVRVRVRLPVWGYSYVFGGRVGCIV